MQKQTDKKQKQKPSERPGKRSLNSYWDAELFKKVQKRATELRLPVSRYLQCLAEKDLRGQGDFTIPTLHGS